MTDLRRLRASLRRHGPWLGVAPALAVFALVLASATDAFARPGGGSSYSGGSRSSGSSSSGSSSGGGGGGDGAGALIQILVWLCLEHPAVGIPLTLIVVGVFVAKKVFCRQAGGLSPVGRPPAAGTRPSTPRPWRPTAGPAPPGPRATTTTTTTTMVPARGPRGDPGRRPGLLARRLLRTSSTALRRGPPRPRLLPPPVPGHPPVSRPRSARPTSPRPPRRRSCAPPKGPSGR